MRMKYCWPLSIGVPTLVRGPSTGCALGTTTWAGVGLEAGGMGEEGECPRGSDVSRPTKAMSAKPTMQMRIALVGAGRTRGVVDLGGVLNSCRYACLPVIWSGIMSQSIP